MLVGEMSEEISMAMMIKVNKGLAIRLLGHPHTQTNKPKNICSKRSQTPEDLIREENGAKLLWQQ